MVHISFFVRHVTSSAISPNLAQILDDEFSCNIAPEPCEDLLTGTKWDWLTVFDKITPPEGLVDVLEEALGSTVISTTWPVTSDQETFLERLRSNGYVLMEHADSSSNGRESCHASQSETTTDYKRSWLVGQQCYQHPYDAKSDEFRQRSEPSTTLDGTVFSEGSQRIASEADLLIEIVRLVKLQLRMVKRKLRADSKRPKWSTSKRRARLELKRKNARLKLYDLRGELFRRGIKAPDTRELLRKKVDDAPQKWVLVEDGTQTQENGSCATNGVLTAVRDQEMLHLYDEGNAEDDSAWEDEIEDGDTFSGRSPDTVTFESEVRDKDVFSEASQDMAVLEIEMQDLCIN